MIQEQMVLDPKWRPKSPKSILNCFTHGFIFVLFVCLYVCICVYQLEEKTQRIETLELDLKTTHEHLQSFQNEVEYIVMISRPNGP